jgi:membrane associated rhomboid family serine protease
MEWRGFFLNHGFSRVFAPPYTFLRVGGPHRSLGRIIRAMPFTWLACINLAIALVFNFIVALNRDSSFGIDNAAHLGGMVGGIILGTAYLWLVSRRRWQRTAGYLLLVFTGVGIAGGAYIVCATDYLYLLYYQQMPR